ncbi:hypothetical protein CEXT_612341 [Caerostris extrusa]|uniref:CYTH domain-containing protein n=1 Tax=Caerostris extrusa TaxID=172846 RepID=A0AAV4PMM5_CAEEX|nr:hypothetical protein CEXT_612341 [Caerostris extrusa]
MKVSFSLEIESFASEPNGFVVDAINQAAEFLNIRKEFPQDLCYRKETITNSYKFRRIVPLHATESVFHRGAAKGRRVEAKASFIDTTLISVSLNERDVSLLRMKVSFSLEIESFASEPNGFVVDAINQAAEVSRFFLSRNEISGQFLWFVLEEELAVSPCLHCLGPSYARACVTDPSAVQITRNECGLVCEWPRPYSSYREFESIPQGTEGSSR